MVSFKNTTGCYMVLVLLLIKSITVMGFPGGSNGKESACSVGDLGSIPGLGRSPGGGNGNPLQYSCLENSMDRGVWRATVHKISELNTTEQLTHNTATDAY